MIVLSLYIIFLYVTLLTYQQMVRTSHKHYCAEKGEKDFKKPFYSVCVDSYFLCKFKLTLIHHLQA